MKMENGPNLLVISAMNAIYFISKMGLLYGLRTTGKKMGIETLETYLDSFVMAIQFPMMIMNVMDHIDTQGIHGWFDEHELMEDDGDDIGYLEDYLIQKDPPYYVNEEEERSMQATWNSLRETTNMQNREVR
ncbi:hypothetical protein Tco_0708629, partial [Tanacetum coccineum]